MSSFSSLSSMIASTPSSSSNIPSTSSAPSLGSVTGSQVSNASCTLAKLTADAATLSARASNYQAIEASLQSLQAALLPLENGTQVAGITASSSSGFVTPTVGNNAVAGTYAVSVTQLAQAQVNTSSNSGTATSAAFKGTGNLGIRMGSGAPTLVAITNGMSLTAIANAINSANAGVTAAIGGSTGAYNLVLTSNATGVANAVNYTQSGSLNLGLTQTQAALDANYSVNGTSYTSTYNSPVYGIPGTSLALTGVVSNAAVTLGADAASVQNAVTSVVSSYNAVITAIGAVQNAQGAIDDPFLGAIQRQLTGLVGDPTAGATGAYNSLASIGVTRNNGGTLTINSSLLNAATTNSAQSVAALVSGNSKGTTGLAAGLYNIATTFAEPGVGTFDLVGFKQNRQALRLARSIAVQQQDVARTTQNVANQYTNLQVALSQLQGQSLIVQTLTAQLGIETSGYSVITDAANVVNS